MPTCSNLRNLVSVLTSPSRLSENVKDVLLFVCFLQSDCRERALSRGCVFGVTSSTYWTPHMCLILSNASQSQIRNLPPREALNCWTKEAKSWTQWTENVSLCLWFFWIYLLDNHAVLHLPSLQPIPHSECVNTGSSSSNYQGFLFLFCAQTVSQTWDGNDWITSSTLA